MGCIRRVGWRAAAIAAIATGLSCGSVLAHPSPVFAQQAVQADVSANGSFQIDRSYPRYDSQPNSGYDDSLTTNAENSFVGFEGQGYLLVRSAQPDAYRLYVNGKGVSLAGSQANVWNKVDISDVTVNGNNILQVSRITPDEDLGSKSLLDVKVPYPKLLDAAAENEGNDGFRLIDQIIQAEIDHGFTSAQIVITKNGKIVKESSYGLANSYAQDGTRLTSGAQVTNDTLYDLASNTKMYATNYAVQKLVSEGKIDINKRVQDYIPDFKDGDNDAVKGKNVLTVKEILQHQAGFPADPQYHNIDYNPQTGKTEPGSKANAALFTQHRNEALSKIIATPLDYMPGTKTVYSDVDYMLLGFIVEQVTGQRLDEYVAQSYYNPMGLTHVSFNPLQHGFTKDQVAATELNGNTRDGIISFDNIRTYTIQGEVHDEKAFYTMEGVSGHAGLFSNAHDLAALTQVTINRGGYGENRFFDRNTLDQFIKPKDTSNTYGLGWRREGDNGYYFYFSPIVDSSTVGHTGWTGTLTVIDPVNNASLVLLTNAKNSPVVNNKVNPNYFVGNQFLTSGYGTIATIAFDALNNGSVESNDAKLVDAINQLKDEIASTQQAGGDVSGLNKRLDALNEVLNQRKDGSSIIEGYLNGESTPRVDTSRLEAAINEATQLDTDSWTASSRTKLVQAIDAARAGLTSTSQQDVDGLTTELRAAMTGVERYTAMSLEQLESSYKANSDGVYEQGSYEAYQKAYDALHDALANSGDLSKTDGEALAAALATAEASLKKADNQNPGGNDDKTKPNQGHTGEKNDAGVTNDKNVSAARKQAPGSLPQTGDVSWVASAVAAAIGVAATGAGVVYRRKRDDQS